MSLLDVDFWSLVSKGSETECWLWQGSVRPQGYGYIRDFPNSAHRKAWELTYGAIPNDLHVLHRCDNPPCVNPSHLFLGTVQDNAQDKVRKGRLKTHWVEGWRPPSGEASPNAKLSTAQVLEIRQLRANGMTLQRISEQYGVNNTTVSRIVRRVRRQYE